MPIKKSSHKQAARHARKAASKNGKKPAVKKPVKKLASSKKSSVVKKTKTNKNVHKKTVKPASSPKKSAPRQAKSAPVKKGKKDENLKKSKQAGETAEAKTGVLEGEEEEALRDLLGRGRSRGFVTDSEIILLFKNIEDDVEFLEEIYEILEKENIKVIET